MDIDELEARDKAYFKRGLYMASVDIYRHTTFPAGYSYSVVWRPGSGAQYWAAGMDHDEFKSRDAKHLKAGRRLVLFDVQNSLYFAVWRPGTGEQRYAKGYGASPFRALDREYFDRGLRLVGLKKHGGNDFAGVWRPGSGTQWWRSGMSTPAFSQQDQTHFKNGLRINTLDLYDGKFIASWRPGSGTQWCHSGLGVDEFKALDLEYFKHGLRLSILRAKTSATKSSSSKTTDPSNSTKYTATVVNGECFNVDGTTSTILTPGSLSATGWGPTKEAAQQQALLSMQTQTCLTTQQDRTPGCCTYRFV